MLCGDVHPCSGPVNDRYVPELSALLKERGMKIFHQNVRGLFSNKTYVQELLHNFGKGIDILTMSETHVCAEDAEPLFDIPGYDFVCKARLTGKGGGVAAYVSDSITWIRRNDLEDEVIECIWLEIILKHTIKSHERKGNICKDKVRNQ